MAKQIEGFMGGFQGKLGPVVGYQWNGKWVVRSRPRTVNNPQTEAQQAHREEFREQVRLAASMRQGVMAGMTLAARQVGMTAYNLFVSLNQGCFDDFSQLRIATGPLAPVGFTSMSYEDNRLEVSFEKNPLHLRADKYDRVYLYVYCPDAECGFLPMPVYRITQEISVLLPSSMAGREVHLWGLVQDDRGHWSNSVYIGHGPLENTVEEVVNPVDDTKGDFAASTPLPATETAATGTASTKNDATETAAKANAIGQSYRIRNPNPFLHRG